MTRRFKYNMNNEAETEIDVWYCWDPPIQNATCEGVVEDIRYQMPPTRGIFPVEEGSELWVYLEDACRNHTNNL